jgi:hypothetical protein
MFFRQFIFLFMLISLLQACADKPSDTNKYFGVQIKSMLPTGTIHKDLTGEASGFRSIIVYITNDSIIPVNLQITFPNEYVNLTPLAKDSLKEFFHQDSMNAKVYSKYKVFLLPDTLTDEKLYQENSLPTEELEIFLNKELAAYTTLTKVVKPQETYKLRLGFLIRPDGQTRAELFSKGHKHNLSIPDKEIKFDSINKEVLELMLGVTLYSNYSIIPCGQLFYTN